LIARLVYPSDWQFVRNGGLEHDQPAVLYATFLHTNISSALESLRPRRISLARGETIAGDLFRR